MTNIALKRDEVHPLNKYRPPAATSAFKLIKWKPIYDQIVAGHIIGRSNKELAAEFDFSEVHIGNILRSDNAQILISEASDRIRGAVLSKQEENIDIEMEIARKAKERIRDFVNNDEIFLKSPFAFIDRVKDLSGLKKEKESSPSIVINNQNNQANIRAESLNRLAEALEISNEG